MSNINNIIYNNISYPIGQTEDIELPIDYNTVYDTEEHQIGWYKVTGGYKPLYRKTVIYPITGTIGGGDTIVHVNIPHNIDNLEYCISCASSISSSNSVDSSYLVPNIGGATGPDYATIVARVTSSDIVLRILNDSWNTDFTFIFTPEYIKTTDTVVAEIPKQTIPVVAQKQEDIYSLDEVRIGTWINGKPIYRKTYITDANASTKEIDIPLQLTNIDEIWIDESSSYLKHGNAVVQIGFYHTSIDWIRAYVENANIHFSMGDAYTNTKHIVVTLKYTKTTDIVGGGE